MDGKRYLLFGKFSTHIQSKYEEEIQGKTPDEIARIQKRYDVILHQYEENLMAPLAQQTVLNSLKASSCSLESLLDFVAKMREEKYGDKVEPHMVFSLYTYKDIHDLLKYASERAKTSPLASTEMGKVLKEALSSISESKIKRSTIQELETGRDEVQQTAYIEELIAIIQRDEQKSQNISLQVGVKAKEKYEVDRQRRPAFREKIQQKRKGEITKTELDSFIQETEQLGEEAAQRANKEYSDRVKLESYFSNIFGVDYQQALSIMSSVQSEMTSEQRTMQLRFQTEMFERINEEMALEVQVNRFDRLFLGKIQGENRTAFLYRAGNFPSESDSISSRVPEKRMTAIKHVADGSKSNEYATPYLSTTLDPLIMATYVSAYKGDPLGARASQMVIDCAALQDIMKDRLVQMRGTETVLKSENTFLRMLLETSTVRENEEYRTRIERRLEEITTMPIYERDSQLPLMINPIVRFKMLEEDIEAQDATRAEAISSLSRGEQEGNYVLGDFVDRVKQAEDYGIPSLEVPIKGSIPIVYTDETGKKRKIVQEIGALESDFIQSLNLLDGKYVRDFVDFESGKESKFSEALRRMIRDSVGRSDKVPDEHSLTGLEAKFAEMYYLQNKQLTEISTVLPGLAEKTPIEILIISEQLRNKVVEKVASDPEIRSFLAERDIYTRFEGVIPHDVKRHKTPEEPEVLTYSRKAEPKTTPVGVRKTGVIYIDSSQRENRIEIITKNKTVRGKAEIAAGRYIRVMEKQYKPEISI